MATALTGRHIPIEIFPFNFNEFLKAKNQEIGQFENEIPEIKGKILNYLDEYLKNGGFPEVVVKNFEPKAYLDTLFDAILLKDVVKRYKVRFSPKIYELCLYLASNFTTEFSATKLKNILDFTSVNTVQKYLRYLEEAYLSFSLNRFSFKTKNQIKSPKKIYFIDNGFLQAKSFQFSPNLGKLMENLIFTELFKQGYKPNENIFYYKTRNQKEIDFVLKTGTKVSTLIQTCYETADSETEKRETKALIEGDEELNCQDLSIITWDKEKEKIIKNKKINFIPLYKWLQTCPRK